MPEFDNLVGRRFSRLLVIKHLGKTSSYKQQWKCVCDCGKTTVAVSQKLKEGLKTSCGCYQKEVASRLATNLNTTHGMTDSPEFNSWTQMKARCTSTTHKDYPNYGGRGITYTLEWNSFEKFYADMGPRPDGTTLERENNSLGYSKSNCKWATPIEQANNRRSSRYVMLDDVRMTLTQASRKLGKDPSQLIKQLKRGTQPKGLKDVE